MFLKNFNVKNKTALVTGSGKGIGKACAIALAEAGANVIILSRTEKDLLIVQNKIKKLKKKCSYYVCDVTNLKEIKKIFSEINKLDILVNNAGTNRPEYFTKIKRKDMSEVVDLNIKASFDIAYSWGVTHHTPDTRKTFKTLSDLVKDRGIFGVYVYVFNPSYKYDKQVLGLLAYLRSFLLIRPFRFICSRLPVSLVKLIFQPIYYLEKLIGFGVFGNHGYPSDPFNKDRYFRVVVDRFKTRYASEHKEEEIFNWFFEHGYNDLRVGKPMVSVSGEKKGSDKKRNVSFYSQRD